MKRVLVVGAHPDDLEWMAGGTVARIIHEGGQVHLITLTKGSWKSPDGTLFRSDDIAIEEMKKASHILGYTFECLNEPTLDLQFRDALVVEVLHRLEKMNADTLICSWIDDLHRDHEIAARIAMSASRRVPRVLMGQGNWYVLKKPFTPDFFVDITDTFGLKMEAMECFQSEMKRIGETWRQFHDSLTRNNGLIACVDRAEGFITYKFTY